MTVTMMITKKSTRTIHRHKSLNSIQYHSFTNSNKFFYLIFWIEQKLLAHAFSSPLFLTLWNFFFFRFFFNSRKSHNFHLISLCIWWCTFDVWLIFFWNLNFQLELFFWIISSKFEKILFFLQFLFFLFCINCPKTTRTQRQNHGDEWKKATVCVRTGYFYKSLFQTTVNPGLNVTCEYRLLFHPAAAALATTALTVLCECAFLRTGLTELRQGGCVCIGSVFAPFDCLLLYFWFCCCFTLLVRISAKWRRLISSHLLTAWQSLHINAPTSILTM